MALFVCHVLSFYQILENIPNFPSEGVEYSPLQANQTKQLVDLFTEQSMKYASLSLDADHQLLFNAVMCLAIQKGSDEFFTDEELSLLTQGIYFLSALIHMRCTALVSVILCNITWSRCLYVS